MSFSSRRGFLFLAAALATSQARVASSAPHRGPAPRKLILAPSNLGLRPNPNGTEPGTWRAPQALMAAGLTARLGAEGVIALDRPRYETAAQTGTRIRNGQTMRRFSLELGRVVRGAIQEGCFPIVIGGDCSVLLGSLYGARRAGGRGLVHVDGHSDFFHPGNYDQHAALGAAAGMDLALVTGRGEALLTHWPGIAGPLVEDGDAIQMGERNALDANFSRLYSDVARTAVTRLIVQDVLRTGVGPAADTALERLSERGLARAWLHVDLDVLDQTVMPASDAPGSPGLDFSQLAALIGALTATGRIVGADVTIYDPELDPEGEYAPRITAMLGEAFSLAPART